VPVHDIEWQNWLARDPATLVFVVKDASVLLIGRKRGLGAGKSNAPGDGSSREKRPSKVHGRLYDTRPRLHASNFGGDPRENAEATPLWAPVDAIPCEEMWQDDRLWIPLVPERVPFSGSYVFDGDRMLRSQRRPKEVD